MYGNVSQEQRLKLASAQNFVADSIKSGELRYIPRDNNPKTLKKVSEARKSQYRTARTIAYLAENGALSKYLFEEKVDNVLKDSTSYRNGKRQINKWLSSERSSMHKDYKQFLSELEKEEI